MDIKWLRFMVFASVVFILSSVSYSATVNIGSNKEVLIDGKPFFPIMQFWQSKSLIATEKEYGFNTFVYMGSGLLVYADECKNNNVWLVADYDPAEVDNMKNHPAFLGWVFGDEPDLDSKKVTPSQIQTLYNEVKSKDPNHITLLGLCAYFYWEVGLPAWMDGSDAYYYEYPKYTDIIGFDYYPVYGNCKPEWIYRVGNCCDDLKNKYAKGQKPLFSTIECCKTGGQWCQSLQSSRGIDDGPYDYEIKCEIWDAIARGANAIEYFTHSWECPGYTQWCISAEQGDMLKKENAKITALTNVLCSADSTLPISVKTADTKGKIDIKAKEYLGNIYLIAVYVINVSGAQDNQTATFTVPGLTGDVQVYDEARTITPAGINFTDTYIKTDSVHIYVMKGSSTNIVSIGSNPLDNIRVYPNPFKMETGKTVKIDQLISPNVNVKIFNTIGNLVKELNERDFYNLGYVVWDGKDSGGKDVSKGIYYYVANDETGNKKTGKIAVIR